MKDDTPATVARQARLSKNVNRWVRTAEAAKIAGCTRATVYNWAHQGLLRTKKTNVLRVWLRDVLDAASK